MKRIIISAGDETFSDLLYDLLRSLAQWDEPLADAIGILDLGLSPDSLARIAPLVTHVVTPNWDLPIDPELKSSKPYLRANTARSFLRDYFPGYDLYLWFDGDTWLQERYPVDYFFRAAQDGAIAIVPQNCGSYQHDDTSLIWRANRLRQYYGDAGAAYLPRRHYFNSGAFCLHKDAVHWQSWQTNFAAGLKRTPTLCSDQTSLNFSIWNDRLPFHPLPAVCNWTCHLAMPVVNRSTKKLCEPHIPHREIGLIHMTAKTKDAKLDVRHEMFAEPVSLRFEGIKRALRQPGPAA